MATKTHKALMSLCLVPLASAIATAQTTQQGPAWTASLGLETEHTDNALRTRNDQISERQDELNLRVGTDYENSWMELEADYNASERRFDKDTQRDQGRVEGQASLRLGKEEDAADLLISNSRRTELNAPDDQDLLSNTDEREVWSLVPTLRWRASSANTLMLQGNYADISFGGSGERDSDRLGASVLWQRQLSATDSLTLRAQQTDIGFAARPDLDYRLSNISIAYQTQLRSLGYRVQVGYNESDPDNGESFSDPSYELELNYQLGAHRFELYADRFLTDNSAGNSNRGDFDDFNPRDSATDQLDQLERSNLELTWRTEIFCARCDFSLQLFYEDSDFQEELEDRTEVGARAQLGYRLTDRSSIDFSVQRRTQEFDSSVERSDFDRDEFRVNYRYNRGRGFGWSLFASYEERDSDNPTQSNTETLVGLRLDYRFR